MPRLLPALLVLAVLPLVGCGVRFGAGDPVTVHRDVGSFSRVEVASDVDLDVRIGPAPSLTLSGGEHKVSDVRSHVEHGTLVLDSPPGLNAVIGGDRVRGTVTLPRLEALQVSGSGSTTVHGVAADAFTLGVSGSGDIDADGRAGSVRASVSGSGKLDLAGLSAGEVDLDVSGSGDADLLVRRTLSLEVSGSGDVAASGTAGTVSAASHGSGTLRLGELRAQDVRLDLHGSGDTLVNAGRTLTVRASGSGDVRYRGAPRVDAQVHGSADVSPVA